MDNSCKEKKKGRIKRLKRQKRLKGLKWGLGLFLSAAVVCNTLLFDASTVFAEEVQEQELCGVEAAEEEEGTGKETATPEESAKDGAAQEEAVQEEPAKDEVAQEETVQEEPAKDEAAQEEAVQDEPAKDETVQDETTIKEETAQAETTKEETTAQEDTTKEDTAEEDTTKKEQTEEKGTQEETAEEMQDNGSAEDTGLCAHHKEHTAECGYSSPSDEGAGSPCTYVCRICSIEELTAALPETDDVSGDNAEEVQAQLEKILALYTELTEEEQEQADISHCLALQEALELLAGQGRAKTPALVLDAVTYLDYDAEGKVSEEKNCDAYEQISSETTTWSGSNEFNGWYVANGAVTISGRVTVTGDVHLILTNGATLVTEAGITVNKDDSLTIYAQPEEEGKDAGSLTATATDNNNAGIGGANKSGGTITINGGTIVASGGNNGAGIGGGRRGDGGTITINGGEVEATGGSSHAAGIGGGDYGSGGKTTINGGIVRATGGSSGAGIGSGFTNSSAGRSGGEITINGGEVNATGGGSAAGIGGGMYASGGNITINGGTVTAAGGRCGAGIGGGMYASGGEVTINGGTITATAGAGDGSGSGAGIGGGAKGAGGTITIVGGTVQATGGYSPYGGSGAHIGGGSSGDAGTVFIGGGTVTKGEGESETYYTVSFVVKDVPDVDVPAQGIAKGKTIKEPSLEIEGYSISGWYKDAAYSVPFDFTSGTIDSTLTLYAKLEATTNYAVEVTIDDAAEPNKYTTIGGAFTAISGKTGVIKIKVLRDVTGAKTLTVGSGMDVTVEMAENVTFTNTTEDCFQVKGGTLTLTGGKVVEGAAGKSVVYAASGTLCITGGTYESKGNGLWISDGADVRLSGGTIGASDTALRYASRKLKEMLDTQEDQCAAFYDENGEVATEILDQNTAKGTYTVQQRPAGHDYEWRDDGTQHYKYCRGCGREKDHGNHAFEDGVCTVCSIKAVARVTAENGDIGYYASIAAAWEALQGKTATMTILKHQSLTANMEITEANTDVTLEMADGVRIDSTSDFFIVKMGKLTINSGSYVSTGDGKSGIYMTDGSVEMNGGTIEMQGAGTGEEKGIQIAGSGTLTISGGELKVTGLGGVALRVDQGTVTLKGGTLTGTNNNKALVINDSTQDIGSLLGEEFKIYKSGVSLGNDELLGKTLEAGTYTVTDCIHSYEGYTHTTGTTVHERKCKKCGNVEQTLCEYEWSDGNSKAVCSVCKSSYLTISTTGTEGLIYDGRQKEPSVTVMLDDGSTLTEGYTVTYADNINAGDGTASVTVEGEVFKGTYTQNFSIGKTEGILVVSVKSFEKTFGDTDFSIPCATNGDGKISFRSDKEDVASVLADGTVQINGAGTAHITVSLAEGKNYTKAADVVVTVIVAEPEPGDCVAKVTIDGVEKRYADIREAWEAAQGHTATMTILKTQTLTYLMEITDANTDVTVEMADGVRLSTTYGIFFSVLEGKLTLNGGIYRNDCEYGVGIGITGGTVVVNDGSIEMMEGAKERAAGIYIMDGTLNICGGELKASGINSAPLYVVGGTVTMTGGTLTNDDGKALWLEEDSEYQKYQNVGSLLGEGYKICKDGVSLTRDELNVKNLEAGTYTVEKCTAHSFPQYTHTAGTTVHEGKCDFCGNMVQEPCRYKWSAGNNTADCVCGSRLTVSTDGTEGLVYDGRSKEPSVTVTLDDGSKLTEGYTVTYTDNINAGNGTASVTVKGEVFEGTFTQNFSIGKAKGTLTVPAVSVEKTFGEADFPLNCTTNGDGQISYTSDRQDVAAVLADGTVQIKGAGTAKITVSLAEGRNYTKAADAAVTVSVAKNGTYRVEEINRRYLYTREHTGEVDLAALLPKDCGAVTYQTPSTSGNVAWKTAAVDTEGKLTYTLANGNTGDKGTITVAVQTQNYEDITITVNVELTDRMPVSVKEGGEVTLKNDTLTYGETLSKLTFNEAAFVDSNRNDVAGTLAWKNPSEMPEAGTVSATWVFTPSDDQYETLEGVIAITVQKAGAAPNLPDSTVEASEDAEKVGDIPLPEGWEWQDADKETPLVPGMPVMAVAVYTGADKGNYETAAQTVTITKPDRSHTGLWVSGLRQSIPYTGSAVTQENIKVYHNSTLLQEKKEYTISYKNNKNAGTAKLIVTGKGNYTGKVPQEFTIEHIDLGAEAQNHISAAVATAAATGKRLKPVVTVTWNGKKLKEKKDYTLSYDANITSASADGYDVTINGVGNYSGSIVRKFRVVPKGTKLLNSAKVSGLAKSYPYRNIGDSAGDAVPDGLEDDLTKLSVKVGKTTLTQGTDYTVRMENIGAVGTAAIIIEPAAGSSYAGEKRVPVLITGTDLKKCSITGLEGAYPYTGAPVTPEIAVFTGKNGSGTQISADAYTIRYANNTKPGKATVTVTGIAEKGYSGTLKATYTIGRADLEKGEAAGTITIRMPDTVSYAKGGAKPKPVVMYTEGGASYTLRENIDYKLKYKNNTAVSEGASRQPVVSITGIGNYSGTVTKNFAVTRQDIGLLTIAAADKAYSAKKKGSAYYCAPKVYDLDGKLLKPKKDYTVRYTDDATGSEIDKTTVIENGTKIRVTVTATQTAKSGYSGTLSTTYLVRSAESVKDVTKAKADKISPQPYTGEPIIPELKLYIIAGGTKTYLTEGEDYEIAGCYNNIQKGTATILIKGKDTGGCSGIKAVTFKITAADNAKIWSGIF